MRQHDAPDARLTCPIYPALDAPAPVGLTRPWDTANGGAAITPQTPFGSREWCAVAQFNIYGGAK